MNKLPTLYSRDSNGGVRVWWVSTQDNTYCQNYGVLDGKIVTTGLTYCEGKNIGKKNETSPVKQLEKEVDSLYKKQLKTGYHEDVKDIDNFVYVEPMLAKNFEDRLNKIDWKNGVLVQNKFNGNRAVAKLENGKVVLKTRKGETWYSVPHINNDLIDFFNEYPSAILDGELFAESLVSSLNELASIVRQVKNFTDDDIRKSEELVRFWIYDAYNVGKDSELDENIDYEIRKEWIDSILPKFSKYYRHVESTECHSFDEVNTVYNRYLSEGQEGAIIRIKGTPYENKRSAFLLKWKPEFDSEAVILAVHEGTADWAGAIKSATIQWKDKIFDATFMGKYELGVERFNNQDFWIGKTITFLYNDLTGLKIPNFARIDPLNCFKNDR